MNPNINLLISAEKIRYQSDFSSAHWLHQVISDYERGLKPKIAEAYETVLRIAINKGCKAAIERASEYPDVCGFPEYLDLSKDDDYRWKATQLWIEKNWNFHIKNRFKYLKEGD